MGVSELGKLRQLEEENAQLKKLVADLSLDKQMLQDVIKKSCETSLQEGNGKLARVQLPCFNPEACRCVKLVRAMYYYKHHRRDDTLLTMRMKEIANTRVRYGFWRIFVLLKREGFSDKRSAAAAQTRLSYLQGLRAEFAHQKAQKKP
jgi:putative transposase